LPVAVDDAIVGRKAEKETKIISFFAPHF
jgi:hypothetical protein